MDQRVEANRRMWDERVGIHLGSAFYDVEGWKAGRSTNLVAPYEEAELGPVAGQRLLHLQCHFGMDTLTFARRGAAEVVGLDFSAEAVAAARRLAEEVGLADRATFVQATVEEGRAAVEGDFDIVYTSWGTIVWLGDLRAWAATIASCLRPGGIFYLADSHPVLNATWYGDYFRADPQRDDDEGTYADVSAATTNNEAWEWQHTLAEVVTVLAEAGLRIELLAEHDVLVWQGLPEMVRGDDGMWRLPGNRIPISFSVRARRN